MKKLKNFGKRESSQGAIFSIYNAGNTQCTYYYGNGNTATFTISNFTDIVIDL